MTSSKWKVENGKLCEKKGKLRTENGKYGTILRTSWIVLRIVGVICGKLKMENGKWKMVLRIVGMIFSSLGVAF